MDKLKTWDEQYARLFDDSSTCVCCGEYVPEGRQVCPSCEKKGRNANRFLLIDDFIIGYDRGKNAHLCELRRIYPRDTSCLTVSRLIGTKRVVVNTLYGEEAEILYSKLVKQRRENDEPRKD